MLINAVKGESLYQRLTSLVSATTVLLKVIVTVRKFTLIYINQPYCVPNKLMPPYLMNIIILNKLIIRGITVGHLLSLVRV